MITNDVLTVFWDGEESAGLTFYVDCPRSNIVDPTLSIIEWSSGTEVRKSRLLGESWSVYVFDVKVHVWPKNWLHSVERTLADLTRQTNSVAWCGLEGCFSDPPDLLDPAVMREGVYAAYSVRTGFYCHTDIDREFESLTHDELLALRAQLGGGAV